MVARRKLGIPTVCLIDTDSNPDLADIPIPGNDDAMRAIDVIVTSLCAAVMEGKNKRAATAEAKDNAVAGDGADQDPRGSRRSSRSQFPANEAPTAAPPAADSTTATASPGRRSPRTRAWPCPI